MLEYHHQHKDYWMKIIDPVYFCCLNEKTKFMSKESPKGRLFPPLPRHG